MSMAAGRGRCKGFLGPRTTLYVYICYYLYVPYAALLVALLSSTMAAEDGSVVRSSSRSTGMSSKLGISLPKVSWGWRGGG